MANNLNVSDEDICKLVNYVVVTYTLGDGTKRIISITEVYNDIYELNYGDVIRENDRL